MCVLRVADEDRKWEEALIAAIMWAALSKMVENKGKLDETKKMKERKRACGRFKIEKEGGEGKGLNVEGTW